MKSVLLIDDSVASALLTQTLFRRKGAKVLVALNVKQGLYLAKTYLPDIIVLDYMLLEQQAFKLFEALKTNDQTKSIPVLVLIEKWDENLIQKCKQFGAQKILMKPFKQSVLLDTVAKMLNIPVRKNVRINVELEITHESYRGQYTGRTINISESGMLLVTSIPLDIHDIIELQFALPDDPIPFKLVGEVVREHEFPAEDLYAFGIHFVHQTDSDATRLRKFIASQLNSKLSESA